MELSQQYGFLEEIVGPPRKREGFSLSNNNTSISSFSIMSSTSNYEQFFPNSWALFDGFEFEENNSYDPIMSISPSSSSSNPTPFLGFSSSDHHHHQCASFTPIIHDNNYHYPFALTTNNEEEDLIGFTNNLGSECFEEAIINNNNNDDNNNGTSCKVEILLEQQQKTCSMVPLPGSVCGDIKIRGIRPKKLEGQPSKNLMAERRRRKRLNDRLSMLRSIVPKISKMDRTSILGDTIDYMKELLERVNKLREDDTNENNNVNLLGISKEIKPSEVLVRNSPKFDVDRREMDTRIDICCATKPGLLLSTVNTLEALGLEIQHCVISCFNDFSMKASCSEVAEQRSMISSEDIKQAIFRNAGYGGKCL